MAKDYHFLHDIKYFKNSPGLNEALNSPILAGMLETKANQVVRLYQARVGYKTGRLRASATGFTRTGGKRMDRQIGVVTIANEDVVSTWKGKPFWYGEYHEEGTLKSKRAKRRKSASRRARAGYHELREVAVEWREWQRDGL